MKRIVGFVIGVVWLGLAFLALRRALGGWERGWDDVGLWWAIIATLLAIAAMSALIGTWLHTRTGES